MIKKLIVVGLFCMLSTSIYAQQIAIDFNKNKDNVSPIVREKMDEFQLKIQEIVNEEKLKLDVSIQQVDQDLEANKLSKEEAKERKQQLAESTSETINQRIKSVNFDLDELIKKQVAFTILNGNDIESISKLEKQHRATHDIRGYIGYGFMGFTEREDKEFNNHLGFSNNFELGLAYTKQFNRSSPWSLKSGLVFSWRTIRLEDNYRFNREVDGTTDIILMDGNLSKSKLRGSYLTIPLGLQYTFGKKITKDNFTYYKEKDLALIANFYGGVKLSNNNIYKGDGIKVRNRSDYNLNPFIYGVQLTFKINSVNIYARKELSNYFKENSFDNRKMFQFGINFGF